MMREQILAWLTENVPTKRVEHILRVEQMAADLAALYGADPLKAAQAGLMHDLAKYFHPTKLLQIATSEGLEIDEILSTHPHLLHADVSAVVARDLFAVEEPEILNAIATHTLGRPGMSKTSCIVFVADCIEPGRGDSLDLQSLRAMSQKKFRTDGVEYLRLYITNFIEQTQRRSSASHCDSQLVLAKMEISQIIKY